VLFGKSWSQKLTAGSTSLRSTFKKISPVGRLLQKYFDWSPQAKATHDADKIIHHIQYTPDPAFKQNTGLISCPEKAQNTEIDVTYPNSTRPTI